MLNKKIFPLLIVLFLFLCNGVLFDGVDDLINCGSNASIDNIFASGGTVSCWIYADSYGTNDKAYCVAKFSTSTYGWILWITNTVGAENSLTFNHNASVDQGSWECLDDMSTGSWHHIAVTYNKDDTANDPSMYLNGNKLTIDDDNNPVGTLTDDSSNDVLIGGRSTDTERIFDGKINEVALWNVALSENEIIQLYKARLKKLPIQIQPSNLKAYWMLDDIKDGSSCDGATFYDFTGNGNNGTGDDGANDSGLTGKGEEVKSY